MNKKFVRFLAIFLAILMALSVLFSILGSISANAATESQITLDYLKYERDQLHQDQTEIESKINSLEYDQYTALAKKQVLDERVALTQSEIDNINSQIEIYDTYLVEKQQEIRDYEQAESDQWNIYRTRIRAMEENGAATYLSVLMGARSFTDLITRIDFIFEIMEYDKSIYQKMADAKLATENAVQELQQAREDQLVIRSELDEERKVLQQRIEEASAVIAEISSNVELYRIQYEEMADAEAELESQIDDVIVELARQEATSDHEDSVMGNGMFIWPLQGSRNVSSTFGAKLDESSGTFHQHYGIDIVADFGSEVLAVDNGLVVTASYDPAYGYYVLINHGKGSSTLYAHLSRIYVSSGVNISQGAVIGLSGSTGASSAPHLHFEVRALGERINPLTRYSDYTITTQDSAPSPSPDAAQG